MKRWLASLIICLSFIFWKVSPLLAVDMEDQPLATLQFLDKITAKVSHVQVPVGYMITLGRLDITIKACRKTPPIETPESAAFLEIDEHILGEKNLKRIFSGWMFASSPALSALDHPVYDLWVLSCDPKNPDKETGNKAGSDKSSPEEGVPSENSSPLED